jgi:hypothetical protein
MYRSQFLSLQSHVTLVHIDLGIGGAEKLMVTAAVALLKVHVISSVERIF